MIFLLVKPPLECYYLAMHFVAIWHVCRSFQNTFLRNIFFSEICLMVISSQFYTLIRCYLNHWFRYEAMLAHFSFLSIFPLSYKSATQCNLCWSPIYVTDRRTGFLPLIVVVQVVSTIWYNLLFLWIEFETVSWFYLWW